MGVDRWLAILAARKRYGGAVCVVDVGTAVTIDQVDDTGQHLGGVIVPGIDLMYRSLFKDTGDIGRLDARSENPPPAERETLGRSTTAAINGGIMSAICGLIESCAAQLEARCRDNVLIITGGDAERIVSHLRIAAEIRPALVLEGLMAYEFD